MKLPGMIYKTPESMRVISCEDTDFANCTETRRSVGLDVQTVGCTLVGWEVGQQDGVGTSTTDVEYRQLAKGCGNANFIMMLLREIAWVDFPAILMEDNMSAIYISKNKQVGKRTKHIDVKYHYTREFISEDEELGCARGTVEKIHTDDNSADIGTKSVSVKTFKHHEEDLDNGMPRLRKLMYGEGGTVPTVQNQYDHYVIHLEMYDIVVILVLNKSIEQRPQVRVAFGYASQRGNTWITVFHLCRLLCRVYVSSSRWHSVIGSMQGRFRLVELNSWPPLFYPLFYTTLSGGMLGHGEIGDSRDVRKRAKWLEEKNSYGTVKVTYRIVTFSIGKFSDSKGSLVMLRDCEQRSKRSYLITNSDGSFG